MTSDSNWARKWETPASSVPRFTEVRAVSRGDRISVLTLFANPLLDKGVADVTCDIAIIRPNGTSVRRVGAVCRQGPIREDPRHVFMSSQVIDFVGEKGDPAGRWNVRVTLRDNVRHVSLPLSTYFVLE